MRLDLREAARAAQEHKALELRILNLAEICSFTDYFLICTGMSTRHTRAITDAILEQLKKSGITPAHVEGYSQAEWVLMDYLDFVVHVFSERARHFYDLERLWKKAPRVTVPENEE